MTRAPLNCPYMYIDERGSANTTQRVLFLSVLLAVTAAFDDRAFHVEHGSATGEFFGIAPVERIVGQCLAVLFVGGERQEIDQAVREVSWACEVSWQPIADDFAT